MRIICVFQGGGAKLVTLLAAAQILEEEMADELEICEVAGTSAGAVAAAALAHERSVKETRAKLKEHAKPHIRHFSRKPRLWRVVLSLIRRKSVYDENRLRTIFSKLFPGEPGSKLKLSSNKFKIPLTIRATDLANRSKHSHVSGENVDVDRALSDSCAIPFAIRNYKSDSQFIDGGLVSNLIEPEAFKNEDAHVLAFSFDKEDIADTSNLLSYLGGLVGTVIDHNVSESVNKIRIASGAVCLLPNDFTTFEFARAFKEGLTEDYIKKNRAEIKDRIEEALAIIGRKVPENKPFPSKLIDRLVNDNPYSVVQNSTVCIVHSLNNKLHPDHQDRTVVFEAKGSKLVALKIGLARNEPFDIGEYRCLVTDAAENQLAADCAIIQSSRDGKTIWNFCILLDRPLDGSAAPVTVRLQTNHLNQMKGLRESHLSDWMRMQSSLRDEIERHDFVIFAPVKSGRFKMTDLLSNVHRAKPAPSELTIMSSNWSPGREMTATELEPYSKTYRGLANFQPFGWRVTGMKPMSFAGALIEREK
ncbi:patatin-like phospholipase family protein [Rhizobium ruizarguesonis]|uniref:patatin-like phospholipase family protein n=1 Tax=Rhizobium ruizarguesonis TaxID=2081791 RepID=UPI0010326483|nr:patatin-like phospholipase family protein [Rhizobium ruizarguesonis]TAY73905.1 hypothetical protein ELH84_08420 [Rhizobium ruizarguesonis]